MCITGFVLRYSKKNIRRNWRLKYTIWLCHAHEGVHCVTFASKPLTLQQLSYSFGKPNLPRCVSWEAFCSFWPKSSKFDVAEVGIKKQRNLLFAADLFTLQLCFLHLLHLFTICWHTGDNVRLSDVVKFSIKSKFRNIVVSSFALGVRKLLWIK